MPRWTKPKNHSFSGSSSVLSCSLSSLNLCGCGWGLGCRGWNSPQVQKVSERTSHVRIRTGAWGQCWPRVRSGRNLVLVSRWDRWRCPGSPSSPRRNWNEMNQEHHPPSAFLMLWSRGEDEEHIPSSEGVQCKAWKPPRAGPPCPRGEDSPVHSAHLPWGRSRDVTVWCCAPRVRCTGRRQVAEVSTDGAVTEGSLASHHCLQAQRKEVRGLVAPGGPTPESPPTPAPRAQTEREHLQLSTEGQAPRDSRISEQGSFHRTGSLGQTHGLWSKETLREHVGLNRPRDYAGVTTSVNYYQRVRTPTCRTRTWEGRAAAWACLCCGFSLEPGPSSGHHRPAWAQQWGLRAQSGLQSSEEWGTEWGPWAWLLLGSLRGTKSAGASHHLLSGGVTQKGYWQKSKKPRGEKSLCPSPALKCRKDTNVGPPTVCLHMETQCPTQGSPTDKKWPHTETSDKPTLISHRNPTSPSQRPGTEPHWPHTRASHRPIRVNSQWPLKSVSETSHTDLTGVP